MNKDVELTNDFLALVFDEGETYSIETLTKAFYVFLERHHSGQSDKDTQLWIQYTWGILQKIPLEDLEQAYGDDDLMHELLYEYFGK
ncbi:MAG: hypothetical protein K0U29_00310 [Gammaproteobacteria bacterium]|nr:hypothetical protein [Gammaproteobacteria bacterium]MCH9743349.1 hypothetical protein [Gammaproteobacteria bacterium]